MRFEERVRFQIDESDLAKALSVYRRVHALFRSAPRPPLAVELVRFVGDAHTFEERLTFDDREHFEGEFAEFMRDHPEIRAAYAEVPYVGQAEFTYWEYATTPPKQID
jgi:hypothetical protein